MGIEMEMNKYVLSVPLFCEILHNKCGNKNNINGVVPLGNIQGVNYTVIHVYHFLAENE